MTEDADIQQAAIDMVMKSDRDAAYVLGRIFNDPEVMGPLLAKFLDQEDEKEEKQEEVVVEKRAVKRKSTLSDIDLLAATLTVPLSRAGYNKLKKLSDTQGYKFMSNWKYMGKPYCTMHN